MKPPKYFQRVCMIFEALVKQEAPIIVIGKNSNEPGKLRKNLTKKDIVNLLFDRCDGCSIMAAIPHGAFAARKVRENNQRSFLISKMEKRGGGNNDKESKQDTGYSKKNAKEEGRELTPLKYNSKLMNSIWGLYNRYSVHNFKKNTDAEDEMVTALAAACWGPAINRNRPPTASTVEETAAATVRKLFGTRNASL